jgi:hypothetical protein
VKLPSHVSRDDRRFVFARRNCDVVLRKCTNAMPVPAGSERVRELRWRKRKGPSVQDCGEGRQSGSPLVALDAKLSDGKRTPHARFRTGGIVRDEHGSPHNGDVSFGLRARSAAVSELIDTNGDPKVAVGAGMVGVAGFEPTTTSPPDWCATRLRYTPREFGARRRVGPRSIQALWKVRPWMAGFLRKDPPTAAGVAALPRARAAPGARSAPRCSPPSCPARLRAAGARR